MPAKSWSPSWAPPSSAPASGLTLKAKAPPISRPGCKLCATTRKRSSRPRRMRRPPSSTSTATAPKPTTKPKRPERFLRNQRPATRPGRSKPDEIRKDNFDRRPGARRLARRQAPPSVRPMGAPHLVRHALAVGWRLTWRLHSLGRAYPPQQARRPGDVRRSVAVLGNVRQLQKRAPGSEG